MMRDPSRSLSAVLVVMVVTCGALLSGCASPRSAFSPSASGCFAALPMASNSVGQRAELLGVRYLSETTINMDLLRSGETPMPRGDFPASTRLCLIGYRGPFDARRVRAPWPSARERASAALVVFSPSHRRIFHTILLDRLPLRLSRI